MHEGQELDDDRGEDVIVRGLVVGEGVADGGRDGRACIGRRALELDLQAGEELGRVRGGELADARRDDVACLLGGRVEVLEKRLPERVGDRLELLARAVEDGLRRRGSSVVTLSS